MNKETEKIEFDPRDKEIGMRIKLKRIERKLSQRDLAEILHLNKQSISDMETGRRKVKDLYLEILAKTFQIDIKDLLPE